MKKKEITIGGSYIARFSSREEETTVRVDNILRNESGRTVYEVTDLATLRTGRFPSAARFRAACTPDMNSFSSGNWREEEERIQNNHRASAPVTEEEYEWRRVREEKDSLADRLRNRPSQPPHLVVEARAGTGKTTTLVEGLRLVRGEESELVPSPQQAEVWDSMKLSAGCRSVCFVAFNKSIATELQQRVPDGCDAMTMHSMGFKSVGRTFGKVKVNQYRTQDLIASLLGKDIRELRREKAEVIRATDKLVSLCKMNLSDPEEDLPQLASHYDIDLNDSATEVFDLVPQILDRSSDPSRDGSINFDDMIWLPVSLNLSVTKYDLLLVDEAQDLNRCQQQLARMAGSRLILCGDPKQAIYGFAGADSESMPRMTEVLGETDRGVETLPLTVTRRCGKAIVKEAQGIVPDFEAHESCSEGKVSQATMRGSLALPHYRDLVEDGDMVLCRVNAPLVSECFKFLRDGVKAVIQGRDVGKGLINTVKKMNATGVPELVEKLSGWLSKETEKENRKTNPSEDRLIGLQDRFDCLMCFTEGSDSVDQVLASIDKVFTDDRFGDGVKLSSVHKAKGLEADRVFILLPEGGGMPHPMAKSYWQREQEMNLKYVAITRAKNELVWVS